jgi:3-oxoacyl-[acyl-carrier protein] reductase
MNLLENKVAVVTGGAQGIGEAIARVFVDHGAHVVIGDLDAAAAERTAKAIDPERVRGFACNVVDGAAVRALISSAQAQFGSIDVMVNNAGITRDASLKKMTEDQFDQVIAVHLRGTWLGTQAAAEAIRAQGRGGAIVNMSSISGKVGNFGQTNYSAAKAGIVGLTKAAAKELAKDGIRANVIQPGLIATAMTRAMPEQVWESKLTDIPMGRAGEPSEIGNVALFLASDLSSYMTGTVLEVTGGRLM